MKSVEMTATAIENALNYAGYGDVRTACYESEEVDEYTLRDIIDVYVPYEPDAEDREEAVNEVYRITEAAISDDVILDYLDWTSDYDDDADDVIKFTVQLLPPLNLVMTPCFDSLAVAV